MRGLAAIPKGGELRWSFVSKRSDEAPGLDRPCRHPRPVQDWCQNGGDE